MPATAGTLETRKRFTGKDLESLGGIFFLPKRAAWAALTLLNLGCSAAFAPLDD
jgi:hypothetical protein